MRRNAAAYLNNRTTRIVRTSRNTRAPRRNVRFVPEEPEPVGLNTSRAERATMPKSKTFQDMSSLQKKYRRCTMRRKTNSVAKKARKVDSIAISSAGTLSEVSAADFTLKSTMKAMKIEFSAIIAATTVSHLPPWRNRARALFLGGSLSAHHHRNIWIRQPSSFMQWRMPSAPSMDFSKESSSSALSGAIWRATFCRFGCCIVGLRLCMSKWTVDVETMILRATESAGTALPGCPLE
mmetsp:Transcript_9908/g.28745  ORF Transcript_9908/g.28745 Transcript_9908/m.28745 type:complete len:237 (-) Transcript_9908:271-981(-)